MLVSGVKGRSKKARSTGADTAVEGATPGIQGAEPRSRPPAIPRKQGRGAREVARVQAAEVLDRPGRGPCHKQSLVRAESRAHACIRSPSSTGQSGPDTLQRPREEPRSVRR